MEKLIKKLSVIQLKLKAPKNQFNTFANFKYRSCEDILEGLKLVLDGLVVTITDDIVMVGDRIYVKATVSLTDGDSTVSNTAFARESLTKKGMDDSQITGTASSYARKYALNGLFLIDDTKDADSMDNSKNPKSPSIDELKKVIRDTGWREKQVYTTFNPPINSLSEIQDIQSCINYLQDNKVK